MILDGYSTARNPLSVCSENSIVISYRDVLFWIQPLLVMRVFHRVREEISHNILIDRVIEIVCFNSQLLLSHINCHRRVNGCLLGRFDISPVVIFYDIRSIGIFRLNLSRSISPCIVREVNHGVDTVFLVGSNSQPIIIGVGIYYRRVKICYLSVYIRRTKYRVSLINIRCLILLYIFPEQIAVCCAVSIFIHVWLPRKLSLEQMHDTVACRKVYGCEINILLAL